jgi:hypothetical protein
VEADIVVNGGKLDGRATDVVLRLEGWPSVDQPQPHILMVLDKLSATSPHDEKPLRHFMIHHAGKRLIARKWDSSN